ncbi:MAG: Gfo/Idh/MocA family oxidoreductase [Opitutaceae bacterium]
MPSPNPKPAAAVVGTGFIGPVHVEALRRLGIPITGILGSSEEKSRTAAQSVGLPRAYRDLDDLLADPAVSVVHLASPNRVHFQQVLACLKAGRHVICEKPLAMNTAETAELARAAAAHPGLICAVNYNIRFYPLVVHARALVRSGEIGDVLHLRGGYSQDWLLYPTDFNWRVMAEEGGVLRAVGDVGTHWLDLIGFITGLEIESVFADLRTVHPVRRRPTEQSSETFTGKSRRPAAASEDFPVTTEDHGTILLRFKGGSRGCLHVSQVTAGRKNSIHFEIAGSRRALAWDSELPNELWIGSRDEPNQRFLKDPAFLDASARCFADYPGGHNEGFPDSFKQLYKAIYADIATGQSSPDRLYADFTDGHRELLLCQAIAESHRTERWVNVPQ